MPICAIKYNFGCLVYNIKKIQNVRFDLLFFLNMNNNIFGFTKKGECKYEYIPFE